MVPPYQLSLDGFEKRLRHGIVVTIALAVHRDLEAVLVQATIKSSYPSMASRSR